MVMPDQWTEIAYVAIADEDGNQYQFGAITDTIDISWGARDIESIATISAGRVTKFIPEEVTEITLEIFPVGISSGIGTVPNGIHGWFMGLEPDVPSGVNNFTRKKFRVSVLWTTVTGITDAAGAIALGDSLRFSFWNCYLTGATLDFTDDLLKANCTFKCPPYDRRAVALIKAEEADNATLATLGPFSGNTPTP